MSVQVETVIIFKALVAAFADDHDRTIHNLIDEERMKAAD